VLPGDTDPVMLAAPLTTSSAPVPTTSVPEVWVRAPVMLTMLLSIRSPPLLTRVWPVTLTLSFSSRLPARVRLPTVSVIAPRPTPKPVRVPIVAPEPPVMVRACAS